MAELTMTRRAVIAGVTTWLAACGGGHAAEQCAAPKLVSVYGDSLTAGSYSATPGATSRSYLSPRPVARIVQGLTGWQGIDHGIPGWDIRQHRQGWESTMAADPARVVVLRFGGGDALGDISPEEFERSLEWMVEVAKAHGKKVILVGVVQLVRKPQWQDPLGMTDDIFAEKAVRAAEMNSAVWWVSYEMHVPFVDVRALQFHGPEDIADAIHPAQAYSDRCADAIASFVP